MKTYIANENITAKSVRLVVSDKSEVVAINVALQRAFDLGLDLVQVNTAEVPVVKILDLNKFNYEQKQAEKEASKKQRQNVIQVKEVKYSFNTQANDINVKLKSAIKFLNESKHVRVSMKVVGRITNNSELYNKHIEVIKSFVEQLGSVEYVQNIELQGKYVTCTIKLKNKE